MGLAIKVLCAGLEREYGIPFTDKKAMYSIANLCSKWSQYDSDEVISQITSPECIKDIINTFNSGKHIGNAIFYAGRRQMIRYWKMQNAQKRGGVGANHLNDESTESVSIVSLNSAISEDTTIEDMVGNDNEIGESEAKDICNKIHNTLLNDEERIIFAMMIQNRSCREIGNIIGKSHEMANRKMNQIKEMILKRKGALIGEGIVINTHNMTSDFNQ